MRCEIYQADTNGKFRANLRGRGFRVVPAVPSRGSPQYVVTARPGRYPLVVQPDQGALLHVGGADARFIGGGFELLDVAGAESGDFFAVEVFEGRDETVIPAGRATRAAVQLAAPGTALPNADPALATDGWPLRPGTRQVTTYFGGAASVATLWVRRLDGAWFNTGDTADPTAAPFYDSRVIAVPGDRFYWRAAAAALTATIEADWEVG